MAGAARGRGADRHASAPRRPPADGRRRRDPVHAGARRLDGRLRPAGPALRARAGRDASTARLPVRPSGAHRPSAPRWPRSARESSRGCARRSRAASGCPTSGRTRSAPPGPRRWAPASHWSPSTSTSTVGTRTPRRRSRKAIRESCGGLPGRARDRIRGARTGRVRHGLDEPRRPRGHGAPHRVRRGSPRLAGERGMTVTDSRDRGPRARGGARRRRHRRTCGCGIRPGPAGAGAAARGRG